MCDKPSLTETRYHYIYDIYIYIMIIPIISQIMHYQQLVHGRKVIIHWPHAKFLPLINRSVNQPPEVIIHC